jgi:hypothetical protein
MDRVFCQRFRSRRPSTNILSDRPQGLLKSSMAGSLDQEIPHPQYGKTGFHEGEQLLIEHQEFLKREPSKRLPPQTQTGCGRTPSLQPKDEEALALQFGPDDVFFLSLNLSIEG